MFDIPIYHKSDIAKELLPHLQTEVQAEYDRREFYEKANPEMGSHYRKLSVYDEKGEHASVTLSDPMVNITHYPELQKIIHTHAIEYLNSLTSFPFADMLEMNWNHYSWWSCFDGGDSYSWHNHSQFFLIATYYLECDEEHTPIAFRNPIGNLLEAWLPGKMTGIDTEVVIKPKTGDLMIWPAWLEHYVYNKTLWQLEQQNDPNLTTHRGGNWNKIVAGHNPKNSSYESIRKSITINYMKPAELFGWHIKRTGNNNE